MKNEPGKFTTEFWVVILANLMTIVTAAKGIIGPEWTPIIIAVLSGVYAALRTWRKNSSEKTELEMKKIDLELEKVKSTAKVSSS